MIPFLAFPDLAAVLAGTMGLNPAQLDQLARRVANDDSRRAA